MAEQTNGNGQTAVAEDSALDKAREYFAGFPEAPYSDSFKWVDANGFEHLSTVRAWTGNTLLSGIDKATAAITSKGGVPAGQYRQIIPAPTTPSEPTRQPIDDSGHELPDVKTFVADRLSVEMKDEKYYYKVIGKPFTQFGVTVWPEVLEAAGLDVRPGQPVPNIAGWKADYVEAPSKTGKMNPQKVTRLLPPK